MADEEDKTSNGAAVQTVPAELVDCLRRQEATLARIENQMQGSLARLEIQLQLALARIETRMHSQDRRIDRIERTMDAGFRASLSMMSVGPEMQLPSWASRLAPIPGQPNQASQPGGQQSQPSKRPSFDQLRSTTNGISFAQARQPAASEQVTPTPLHPVDPPQPSNPLRNGPSDAGDKYTSGSGNRALYPGSRSTFRPSGSAETRNAEKARRNSKEPYLPATPVAAVVSPTDVLLAPTETGQVAVLDLAQSDAEPTTGIPQAIVIAAGQVLSGQAPSVQIPSEQAPSDQVPTVQVPAVQAPSGQVPAVQASPVQAPPDQAPPVQAPPGQAPTVQAPMFQAPTFQAPPGQVSFGQVTAGEGTSRPAGAWQQVTAGEGTSGRSGNDDNTPSPAGSHDRPQRPRMYKRRSRRGPGDSPPRDASGRRLRASRWTSQQVVKLLEVKRIQVFEIGDMPLLSRFANADERWADISAQLEEAGIDRDASQCRKKYENVFTEYKKLKSFEGSSRSTKPYKLMTAEERAIENLPPDFPDEYYEIVDSFAAQRRTVEIRDLREEWERSRVVTRGPNEEMALGANRGDGGHGEMVIFED